MQHSPKTATKEGFYVRFMHLLRMPRLKAPRKGNIR
jgi:hypothetical protein